MALFVPGMLCCLCGKPMQQAADILLFPPFVANKKDPLFIFSDAVVHAECFRRSALAEQAQSRYDEFRSNLDPAKRICVVCGRRISSPEDYFTVGFLTDDPRSPVHEFNYLQAHKSHLARWENYSDFRRTVEEFQSSAAWEGPRIAIP